MAREMMQFTDGEYYTVLDREYGHTAIDLLPRQKESVEGCREAIDRINAWRRSEENTWESLKPEQFLIAVVKWNKMYYADGSFMESNEKVKVLEMYPETL